MNIQLRLPSALGRMLFSIKLLSISSLPSSTNCVKAGQRFKWTARRRAGWQIRIVLIDFGESVPAILAAAYESNAVVLFQFLTYPSRHDLTVCRRKLDVDRQPHTLHFPQRRRNKPKFTPAPRSRRLQPAFVVARVTSA
jgi:hypothetical protein